MWTASSEIIIIGFFWQDRYLLPIQYSVTNMPDSPCPTKGKTGLLLRLLEDPAVTKKACAQMADKQYTDSREFQCRRTKIEVEWKILYKQVGFCRIIHAS